MFWSGVGCSILKLREKEKERKRVREIDEALLVICITLFMAKKNTDAEPSFLDQ